MSTSECKRGEDIFEYSKHNHYCACSVRDHSTTFDWPGHSVYKNIDTSAIELQYDDSIKLGNAKIEDSKCKYAKTIGNIAERFNP